MPASLDSSSLTQLKTYLSNALTQEFQAHPPVEDPRRAAWQALEKIRTRSGIPLEGEQRSQVFRQVIDNMLGYGPIQQLLDDPSISEIMVNGSQLVFIERNGELFETELRFEDDAQVLRIIDRMIHPLGRRVDREHPMVDARLPDGSRVNAIIPPA